MGIHRAETWAALVFFTNISLRSLLSPRHAIHESDSHNQPLQTILGQRREFQGRFELSQHPEHYNNHTTAPRTADPTTTIIVAFRKGLFIWTGGKQIFG